MPNITSRFVIARNGVDYSTLLAVDGGNPTIRMTSTAEVKMVLEGTFLQNPQLNLVRDRLKPFYSIDGVESQMGEFLITDAALNTVDGVRKELEITAYDLTYLAKRSKIEDRILIPAGTLYTAAIGAQIIASGITNFLLEPNAAVITENREDWDPGTSRLTIINDLLAEINYNSLWMDNSGLIRGTPYRQATAENITIEYRNDAFSLLLPEDSSTTDVFDRPNVFIAVVENPEKSANMRAVAVNDDPSVDFSTVNIGRVAEYEKLDNIASQAELQAYVNNKKFKSLLATQEITFSTAANPAHSAFDVIGLYKDDLTGIYEETEWSMSFQPGEAMTHRAKKVVYMLG